MKRAWLPVTVVTAFMLTTVLTSYVNAGAASLLDQLGVVDSGRIIHHQWIAGFTEPIASKLLPALVILGLGAALPFLFIAGAGTILLGEYLGLPFAVKSISALSIMGGVAIILFRRDPWYWPLNGWVVGAVGGFVFGIIEVIVQADFYGVDLMWRFWEIEPVLILFSIPYHTVEGAVVVGTFYAWLKGEKDVLYVIVPVVTIMLFHAGWNLQVT